MKCEGQKYPGAGLSEYFRRLLDEINIALRYDYLDLARVIAALKAKYGLKGPEDILAPVGTANAYDAIHLVALAIDKAGAADGAKVRDALENLGEHKGLIKTYKRPFTPEEHDALTEGDYILVTWRGGKIVPVASK